MEVSESKFTFVGNPCDYHVKPTIALIEAIKKGATEKTEMRLANNFLYITSEARHKSDGRKNSKKKGLIEI